MTVFYMYLLNVLFIGSGVVVVIWLLVIILVALIKYYTKRHIIDE